MLNASEKAALRKDPAGSAVIASWRRLTGGRVVRDEERRTLVAVSGGCDSSALLLALASASGGLVVGHVVHDLRARAESLADRDAAAALARRVGAPLIEEEVQARAEGGNLEAAARRLRYRALARMARESGCGFIATAHHADDLLETVLMRLLRGAGPAGLAPIRSRRRVGGVVIVRPMLGVTRADAERLCGLVGHRWAVDASNEDVSRVRNDLRASVVPELRRISPLVAQKVGVTSELVGQAAGVVRGRARRIVAGAERRGGALVWGREGLRGVVGVVLGEVLRLSARELCRGWRMDRLSHRVLLGAVRAIGDGSTEPRVFEWGALRVRVSAREVVVERG